MRDEASFEGVEDEGNLQHRIPVVCHANALSRRAETDKSGSAYWSINVQYVDLYLWVILF